MRTFLRGYANERTQGFELTDYALPAEALEPMAGSDLPHFTTAEFFEEVRSGVIETLDQRAAAAGFM